jgi:hypothetical protein
MQGVQFMICNRAEKLVGGTKAAKPSEYTPPPSEGPEDSWHTAASTAPSVITSLSEPAMLCFPTHSRGVLLELEIIFGYSNLSHHPPITMKKGEKELKAENRHHSRVGFLIRLASSELKDLDTGRNYKIPNFYANILSLSSFGYFDFF